MMHRVLETPLKCYRLGDSSGKHPVFSAAGAAQRPGRWNRRGEAVIYCAEHYSTALLELLVYLGELPEQQHFVEINVPAGTSYEVVTAANLPEWNRRSPRSAQRYGSQWLTEQRSAILLVPSVPAPFDRNILINPNHPDFANISTGLEMTIPWDERLFSE